jgi:hypothetical protein
MLLLAGVLLLALGLLSGAALVLASFGILAAVPGFTLWVTFPLLCLAGFALVAVQAKPVLVRVVSLVSSGLLLVLALASIAHWCWERRLWCRHRQVQRLCGLCSWWVGCSGRSAQRRLVVPPLKREAPAPNPPSRGQPQAALESAAHVEYT